jgi:dihydroneopterin aldolase
VDKVFIRQLEIATVIGVYDWEQQLRQSVVLDLEMAADIRTAAASHKLEDALDYHAVASRLQDFVGNGQFLLLETLAEQCAEIVLREFAVSWLQLRLSKPGAVAGAKEVGVQIERERTD